MSEVERLLRGALVPIDPPERLSERLERRLTVITDAAVDEWADFDESALRDPRRWARLVAAGVIGAGAGGALIVVRARQKQKQARGARPPGASEGRCARSPADVRRRLDRCRRFGCQRPGCASRGRAIQATAPAHDIEHARGAGPADAERAAALEALRQTLSGFFRAQRRLRGRDARIEGGVSFAHYPLLGALAERGRPVGGPLATEAGLTPATVTQMVDTLSAAGLVERTRSDRDRRVVTIQAHRRGPAQARAQAGRAARQVARGAVGLRARASWRPRAASWRGSAPTSTSL